MDVTFTEGDPDWTDYIFGATLVSFTFDGFEGTLTTPAYVADRTSTSAKLEFTKAESDPEDPSNGTGGEFVVNGAALTLNAAGLGSTQYPYQSPPAKFRYRDTNTIMEDGIEITEPSLCMITGYDRWVAAYGSGVAGTHILQFDINADTETEQSVQLAAASYTISSGRFEAQAMSPAFTGGAGQVLNTGRLRVTYGGFYPADVQVIAVRLVVVPLAGY